MTADPFYVTTPIYYVNAEPHIGHAYTSVTADALSRWHKLLGGQSRLATGTDEHGLKIQRAAEAAHLSPQQHANATSASFKTLWDRLGIKYDYYTRTTQSHHHTAVQSMLSKIRSNGHIREGRYEGLYCVPCEAYYTELDLIGDKCPVHDQPVEWMSEQNWFFRLSDFSGALEAWLVANPDAIFPNSRRLEALSIIRGGLEDVSISRSSISWGVPVPWDTSQVFYVWYDALINYVTALGYPNDMENVNFWWPHANHLIAKDILRFHCVYWPVMLMAADMEPPNRVIVSGFLNTDGAKVSKTGSSNLVTPDDFIALVGVDGLRHHFLHDVGLGSDSEFSVQRVISRYNSDLANTLGNTVSRLTKLVATRATSPDLRPDPLSRLSVAVSETLQDVKLSWDIPSPSRALNEVWRLIATLNTYLESEEPWRLPPGPKLDDVLGNALELLRVTCVLVWPAIPESAEAIWTRIGLAGSPSDDLVGTSCTWGLYRAALPIASGQPLFPRVDA